MARLNVPTARITNIFTLVISSMILRTSSDSLNVGIINITIFLLVHLIGELHKVYIMTMLILVKSTNLTTINKKMCNTSLTNQQEAVANGLFCTFGQSARFYILHKFSPLTAC